jgi:hypothetical protein
MALSYSGTMGVIALGFLGLFVFCGILQANTVDTTRIPVWAFDEQFTLREKRVEGSFIGYNVLFLIGVAIAVFEWIRTGWFKYWYGRDQFVIVDIEYSDTGEITKIGNRECMYSIADLQAGLNKKYYFYIESPWASQLSVEKAFLLLETFAVKARVQLIYLGFLEYVYYKCMLLSPISLTLDTVHSNKSVLRFVNSNGDIYTDSEFIDKKYHKRTNRKIVLTVTREQRYEDYPEQLTKVIESGVDIKWW